MTSINALGKAASHAADPRAAWREFWRLYRKAGGRLRVQTDRLEARARLAAEISEKAEDGQVVITESGWDCDHVFGYSSRWVPAFVIAVERELYDIHDWADGPVHTAIVAPSVAEEWSDAMRDDPRVGRCGIDEAHENGNPFSVTH